ncbi:type IV secretion system protein (plasmid) [Photobacterium damselae subsp. piscicida]|uniref:Type IV secretion system protein n=1 Tax=Photobacterium damsela subsp. piscicida TaxID=38294 RepID=A0A7L8AAK3_PHODP|nr:type IV secretion system protein [Photobacterium damselae]QOD55184.1 type IV secretion system protein [Photobacterium damselae subsp. piscicida]QOD59010.1 type IV secretion system protein [Photobacterium damselae subsp. piscicida]
MYETLDNLLAKGVNQAAYCFEQAGWTPATWTWLFCAFVVMASIGTLTVRAGLIVIGTKFLLSVLLVIGPLFFIAACFPVTRRFIDSWLNKVLENILVQLFGITVVVMATKIIGNFIKVNDITKAIDANPAGIAVQVAIVSGILLYVIQQIPNLAGALSGSFASAMLKISMPKLNPMNAQHSAIAERASWAQQQQNQLSHGGAVKGSNPKHDLSQDLKDRIAAHNMKHRH